MLSKFICCLLVVKVVAVITVAAVVVTVFNKYSMANTIKAFSEFLCYANFTLLKFWINPK